MLSYVGKLTLVKSMVQSIPTYLMTHVRIPVKVVAMIEAAIVRFLCSQKTDYGRSGCVGRSLKESWGYVILRLLIELC